MVDSTAAYERGPDAANFSLIGGDRASVERAMRPTTQTSDGFEGAGPEHVAALLRMGALKQDAGDYSEAAELFRRALEIGERALGAENLALVPAMTSLASARIMCGKFDDAEPLVTRALAISENGLAEHDPDLAIVLNDLARLCLKQSAYALAEPLLLRMWALKRSKGEDHPEVATVLASLATVRQALGRHESAEQLWRRVLDIRERTLAPNHFALATALEHLGEACAARGKIGEALQLLQRAETIRELTLGTGHASLRTSRDRIADLQLQAEESLDASALDAPAPERYRLLSADHSVVSSTPPVREKSTASPRKGTARVIERDVSTRDVSARDVSTRDVSTRDLSVKQEIAQAAPPPQASRPQAPAPQASRPQAPPPQAPRPQAAPPQAPLAQAPQPPVAGVASANASPSQSEPVNYRDVIMSIREELEVDEDADVPSHSAAEILGSVVAGLKQRQKATVISVAAVALLVVLATVSRAGSESAQPATDVGTSTLAATPSTPVPLAAEAPNHPAALANDPEKAPATASAAATPVTSSRIRAADQRTPAKPVSDRRPEPTRIMIPKVSSALTAGFDSVVLARSASARGDGDPFSVQPPLVSGNGQRMTFGRDDLGGSSQRAQLIGSLPAPRYPGQLKDVEGEVQVRFQVDISGRPVVSSISVVRSSDALFTAATLKVIPALRFEPARTGGSDSKAVVDVVQMGFQFRPAK